MWLTGQVTMRVAGLFTDMSSPLSQLLMVLCPSPGTFLLREAWQGLSQPPRVRQARKKESQRRSHAGPGPSDPRELWLRHACLPGAPSPGLGLQPGHPAAAGK